MKTTFSKDEFEKIKELLKKKEDAISSYEQKKIRAQLRRNGYYISDFDGANTVRELQDLVHNGIIKVVG